MATHSSILAGKSHGQRTWRATVHRSGRVGQDSTETALMLDGSELDPQGKLVNVGVTHLFTDKETKSLRD